MRLKAPFPWFGGKSRAAHIVWDRFGDVPNYVEPFAGSLAVLLGRPTPARIETVNDLDCFVANFWRAVAADPEGVARFADWPINEVDLHARHRWLVAQSEFRERMIADPEFFDAKVAGWWVWGLCQWIGSGWCSAGSLPTTPNGTERSATLEKRPIMARGGRGVHGTGQLPHLAGNSDGQAGRGAHSSNIERIVPDQLPQLRGDSGAAGSGIHASGLSKQIPYLKSDGQGISRRLPKSDAGTLSRRAATGDAITEWMLALQARLRRTRVACGDWSRILGPSVTEHIGVTGILLDPPYGDTGRDPSIYTHDDMSVAADVREWAIVNGDNPKLRIALCGYEGEHDMPQTWECVAWKALGGYASAAGNHENAKRERIWFSGACLRPQGKLFV